ncbi:ATP phosphoribosyltransferase regulatory subunit [Pseudomonas sp. B21-028]|uniref:ATP phosphoribosyltransferase regulatory subunit n=1 Tax=Pseudomonas sp. B21-028 TaxID=2895480 RepID=UPI00215EDBB2|nr:ATP phosphoribosyltransferase regulatory subunit [Pseudomonas sp. B21-028]UVL84954.1 ATP phosphoribosyltransferase regulatory subunit [Pseudomonas sp. B21-028]
MSTLQFWLDRLRNKQKPTSIWADHRRNEALEALAGAGTHSSWIELSHHYNGFVREIAVRELYAQPSPEALVAMIDRSNDWVPQIRDLAAVGLEHYLSPAHAQALLFAVEPLIALAARQRADHGKTLKAARAVLQSPVIRDEVQANFLTRHGKAARYLFELLLESDSNPEALLRSALFHREVTVRLLAVPACLKLPTTQARCLLLEALSQPGAKFRVWVLRALLPLLGDPRPILCEALLDASASIRSLARWAAPNSEIDPHAVLVDQMKQSMPSKKRDWLGVLGLSAELNVELDPQWQKEALRSGYPTVRRAAIGAVSDAQLPELLKALDDPSNRVFNAAIARLSDQPWALVKPGLDTKMDRDWHDLSVIRRSALLQLRPLWQQAAYLLDRLDAEPTIQAFWLRQLAMWGDGQYQMVDPVTPKIERTVIVERLRELAARGLIGNESIARVV